MYEPFPVESSLPEQLPDHLNAEIVICIVISVVNVCVVVVVVVIVVIVVIVVVVVVVVSSSPSSSSLFYFSLSSLPEQLPDHLNAEIVNGAIRSKQQAMNWIGWTYFYRR